MSSNENLRGTIPSEIGHPTVLERLNLRKNALTGTIPSEIGKLKALYELNMFKNQLTGSLPSSMSGLIGLEKLTLHDNQMSGDASESSMICNMRDDAGGSLEELRLVRFIFWTYTNQCSFLTYE